MPEKEFIERGQAINEFAIRSSFYDAEWRNKRFTPDDVNEILRSIPAADVRPVVRGKWIQRKNWTRCVCSACSWEITFVTGNSYNFCPNCGADMREEQT